MLRMTPLVVFVIPSMKGRGILFLPGHRILNIPKILNYKRISFIIIIDMGEKGRTDQVIVIGLLRPL